MKNGKRVAAILLAAALLSLCACSDSRGRTVQYDGYTVRTEKPTGPATAPDGRTPDRSVRGDMQEDYVLNKNSLKFHYPHCSGVEGIRENNRWDYRGTRESVIEMGYTPCRLCNP